MVARAWEAVEVAKAREVAAAVRVILAAAEEEETLHTCHIPCTYIWSNVYP